VILKSKIVVAASNVSLTPRRLPTSVADHRVSISPDILDKDLEPRIRFRADECEQVAQLMGRTKEVAMAWKIRTVKDASHSMRPEKPRTGSAAIAAVQKLAPSGMIRACAFSNPPASAKAYTAWLAT